MKKVFKKTLSVVLALCMTLSVFVFQTLAADSSVSSFSEFVNAVASAADGECVSLSADITVTETVNIPQSVTVDGNSHSLIRAESFSGQIFKVSGALTLKNVVLNGNRTSTEAEKLASELVYINSAATVNLEGGAKICTNRADSKAHTGGIWIDGGTLNMYDGAELYDLHQHNTTSAAASYGTAVNIMSGSFNMYGGKISGCDGRTGAVGNIGGEFVMKGGEISSNTANNSGDGGGAVFNSGVFRMYDGKISDNVSWKCGGGVSNTGTFNLYGGTISGNSVTLKDSTTCEGGGVYTLGTFNMTGGEITGNTAQSCGGGIQINGGRAVISGGTVSGNTASSYSGGGVFVGNSAVLSVTNGSITGNSANQYGGGIAVTSNAASALSVTGGEIYSNTCGASQCGTDIYVTTATSSAMTQFGEGCIVYKLYLDNQGSRYSSGNAIPATSSSLTAGNGYIYVSNGVSHSFSDWTITTEPTCETFGVKERSCTVCGYREEETVPPKGHNTIAERTEPTCSEDGSVKLYCPVCGYVHKVSVIPATGHIAPKWSVLTPATSSADGVKVKKCIYCGEVIESAGYSYSDPSVYLTFGEPAEKDADTNTVSVSVNLRGNPGLWASGIYLYYSPELKVSGVSCGSVFPSDCFTCEAQNVSVSSDAIAEELFRLSGAPVDNTLYTCVYAENGGVENTEENGTVAVLTFEYSSSLEGEYTIGFVYDEDNIINCDGDNVNLLFEDGKINIEPLVKCDHVAGDWNVVQPTCTEDGYRTRSCIVCGKVLEREVLHALGHTAGDWIITVEPGYTAGEKVRRCVRCDTVMERETIRPLYMPQITVENAAANGTSADVKITVSNNPGMWGLRFFVYYSEEIEIVSVTNGEIFGSDSLSEAELNASPADNELLREFFDAEGINTDGIRAYCVYFENETISDIASNGTLITLRFKVPANFEKPYKLGVAVDDTLNAAGDSLNFEYFEGSISPSVCSHEEASWQTVKEASCTEEGSRSLVCPKCGEIIKTESVAPNGHTFSDEFTIDVEATRQTPGVKSRHCLYCDAVTEETEYYIILLGDVNGDGKINLRDVLTYKKALSGDSMSGVFIEWNADLNSDGKLNSRDFAMLKRMIADG